MAPLDLGINTKAYISLCRVLKRPTVVDMIEYHDGCGEGILPLDADVLIHVAPATPKGEIPLDRIEVFRIPRGTFVSLRAGVWHHAPFVVKSEVANALIVLPERTYAADCEVYEIAENQRTEIIENNGKLGRISELKVWDCGHSQTSNPIGGICSFGHVVCKYCLRWCDRGRHPCCVLDSKLLWSGKRACDYHRGLNILIKKPFKREIKK